MALNQIWSSDQSASALRFRATIWYDTVAQALVLQCDNGTAGQAGDGHGVLDVEDNRASAPLAWNPTLVASIDCAQFNDGQQHVIVGPGAVGTGVDKNGRAGPLPTTPITTQPVLVSPVRGQFPTMSPNLRWSSV